MSKWYVAERLRSLDFHNRLKGKVMAYQAEVSDIRGGKWGTVCESQLTLLPTDLALVADIEPGDIIEITVIKKKENPYV